MSMTPYLSKVEERSEKEHKDLIQTANNGLGAIKKLSEKYADLTDVKFDNGTADTLSSDHGIDFTYGEKK